MVCAVLSGRQGRKDAQHDAHRARRRTLPARQRRPSGRAQALARGVAGLNRRHATLFGQLLADRTPERDAGRDLGEKSGLRVEKIDRCAPTVVFFMPALQPQRQPERGGSASVFCVALLLSLLVRPRCPVPAALTHEPGNGERPACPRRRAFFLVPTENIKATTADFNPFGEKFFLPPTPPPLQAKEGDSEASARKIALSLPATACTHLEYGCVLKVASMRFEGFVIRWF